MDRGRQTTVEYLKTSIFRTFGRYVFGSLGNEANIIILYQPAPCRLCTDPKISLTRKYMTLNDRYTFIFQFSLLRTTFQQLGYILVIDVFIECFRCRLWRHQHTCTEADCKKWSAEYCGSAKVLWIFRRRKVAGATAYIVGTLTN